MDYIWTVYLRDIFVILAAAALILVCGYVGLVSWQIYRMARELSVELEPVLASAQNSAQTVESTANFMANRFSTPATTATNTALGVFGLFQLYRQARQATLTAPPSVGVAVPPVVPPPAVES